MTLSFWLAIEIIVGLWTNREIRMLEVRREI